MRIAILITAYKNKNQLEMLIDHLSKDFDVYVHIDRRSSISIMPKSPRVKIFKKYNSYWGSLNCVLAVLYLLKEAAKQNYDRYIQLSGQDLPIKTNAEIIIFFTSNQNKEYFDYVKLPSNRVSGNGGLDRIQKYWGLAPQKLIGLKKIVYKIVSFILKIIYISPIKKLFIREIDYNFFGGSNYMDLTHSCVKETLLYLSKNPDYIKRFKYTRIPEEIFFQTIFMNLSLKTEIINKTLRYVDWNSGPDYPKTFVISDFDRIMTSDCLFARKFDENRDKKIIDEIYNRVRINAVRCNP